MGFKWLIQNITSSSVQFLLISLLSILGECNYGGRVTDDKDRRLLLSLLSIFYSQELIEQERYYLSEVDMYYVPPHGPYQV